MAVQKTKVTQRLALFEGPEQVKLRTWILLARTFYLIQRRVMSALAKRKMTLPQFDVLATLRFSDGVTQQELAERMLVTKGNICGLIDRLERLGWVERRTDSSDRRINHLHLTASGKKRIDSVLPEHDALVVEALRPLSMADAKTLQKLLTSLEESNT